MRQESAGCAGQGEIDAGFAIELFGGHEVELVENWDRAQRLEALVAVDPLP